LRQRQPGWQLEAKQHMTQPKDAPGVMTTTETQPVEETRTRRIPPYNVILLNDEHHSMEFVVEVLCKVLGVAAERAYQFMMEAHTSGRAIIWSGSKEVAELKLEQIQSLHEIRPSDNAMLGPLGCDIEPA
jgi:ATP-dependent Clp protease adaptor protein ClpS